MNCSGILGRLLYIPVTVACVLILIAADNFVKMADISLKEEALNNEPAKIYKEQENMPKIELIEKQNEEECVGKIDINSASLDELDKLSGIGRLRAEAIVAQREKMGGFMSCMDILCTDGIGDKIYARIKDYICVLPYQKKNNGF